MRVVPFARIREIVGRAEFELATHDGATAGELWAELAATYPSLDVLRASTRLPPFGGG